MNREALQEKEEFRCPGLENGAIGEGIRRYGELAFSNPQFMYQAALINQKRSGSYFLKLPLNYDEELKALGGKVYWNGETYMSEGYQYKSIKEMYHLAEISYSEEMFRSVFQCLEKTDDNENVMLCVEGSFSVLCSLINMMTVLREYRKEKFMMQQILSNITDILADYIIDALKRNVKIVSLADPVASLGMMGEKCFRDLSGKYMLRLLRKIKPYLNGACVHLCGKSSLDLKNAKLITYERLYYEGKYAKCVMKAAREHEGCVIGNGCINCEKMHTNKIEMVKFDNAVVKLAEKVV